MAKKMTITPEKATHNANAVLTLWRTGRASATHLRALQRGDPAALRYLRKEETYDAEARRLGINVDTAGKARRFAREYKYAQVQELSRLIRQHRSRFSASHLLALLRVGDQGRRDPLMRRAIEEGWTTARLARAVQAVRGGRREHVGRDPDVPADPAERLLALDALCEKWSRWCNKARPGLPEGLHDLVDRATVAVRKVQGATAAQLRSSSGHSRNTQGK